MITRIYIDNYKCFSNFEYSPAANELLLGRNGTGKSSVFDVLRMLREVIYEGTSVAEAGALGEEALTAWDSRRTQSFGLDVAAPEGTYKYALSVECPGGRWSPHVGEESLDFCGSGSGSVRLFGRRRDRGVLFHDDGSEGPEVVTDIKRSGLSIIHPRPDNAGLTWFKERIGRTHCVRTVPGRMSGWTETEDEAPRTDLSNYASWYRHLNQEEPRVREALHGSLAEVVEGFSNLSLKRVTEAGRHLCADLDTDGKPFTYDLSQLSDGQRALIALYTLSAYAREFATTKERPVTLCIDEPENFVALSELQPWIHEMEDCADGEHAQVLIASHHPEFIDHYAHTSASLLYRDDGGPVRVKPFTAANDGGLPPSEIVARGWEDA